MISHDRGYIIKSLDNQMRFLFWELDEFGVLVIPLFLGILTSSVLMMCSGLFWRYLLNKFKKKFPRGSLKHYLYWNLPTRHMKKMVGNCPPSHLRELIL